ncbi:MAG: hypothetical protein R3Y64_11325 [Peptostreptococcaceae bacterium]
MKRSDLIIPILTLAVGVSTITYMNIIVSDASGHNSNIFEVFDIDKSTNSAIYKIIINDLDELYEISNELNESLSKYDNNEIKDALENSNNLDINNILSIVSDKNLLIRLNHVKDKYEVLLDYEYMHDNVRRVNTLNSLKSYTSYLKIKANQLNNKTFGEIVYPQRNFVNSSSYEMIELHTYNEDMQGASDYLNKHNEEAIGYENVHLTFDLYEEIELSEDDLPDFIKHINKTLLLDELLVSNMYEELLKEDFFMMKYVDLLDREIADYKYGLNHNLFRFSEDALYTLDKYILNPKESYLDLEKVEIIKETPLGQISNEVKANNKNRTGIINRIINGF